ncbi:ALG6/ALG8 family glucosyltransferase xit [Musca autumnalis]|uniref:ALG6/ALG8 family glucosyltransferase xit n=1 Tax=Musca autumnalis TaxID=221902 RepID=UPI003CED7FA4
MGLEGTLLWPLFAVASCLKLMLVPAYHSTDFEVHRNWLAITHSLPLKQWYYEATSEWTLDYPPFFAYFEWALSKVAAFVYPKMLEINNLNYASTETKYFQRISVMFMDFVYMYGVWRCLRALRHMGVKMHQASVEVFLVSNIGLIFVDHIHFQYNGFLFGILLLSISYLLEERYVKCAFIFACLLNFKHIFVYMAPAFGVYLLRHYCLDPSKNPMFAFVKLLAAGLSPFAVSFGPFWQHIPQVLSRLFPFKRGLTHAYWAPNFWALYNTADKVAAVALKARAKTGASTTSGLVQEFEHVVLPSVRPAVTFVLTVVTMIPILIRLCRYQSKRDSKIAFIRAVVICSACSFMFGWHVHEKAILMCLIPLCFLFCVSATDAKYAFMLSAVGYFSLFPLLFQVDLFVIRYSLYLAYMAFMYLAYIRFYQSHPAMNILEDLYIYGLVLIPIYEHIVGPMTGLNDKLSFVPLLLYSSYCGVGVTYCFIRYYIYALELKLGTTTSTTTIKANKKHEKHHHQQQQTNLRSKIVSNSSLASKSNAEVKTKTVKHQTKKSKEKLK